MSTEQVGGRAERIPPGKAFRSRTGDVAHYATQDIPINSFGARRVRTLCGLNLFLAEPSREGRCCERCWTKMVRQDVVHLMPADPHQGGDRE